MLNANVSYLFSGRFSKVAESKETITDKKTGDVTNYYSVCLSNGVKTFNCTCGVNADVVRAELFKPYTMYIDVVEKNGISKLKVVAIDFGQGSNKGGAK